MAVFCICCKTLRFLARWPPALPMEPPLLVHRWSKACWNWVRVKGESPSDLAWLFSLKKLKLSRSTLVDCVSQAHRLSISSYSIQVTCGIGCQTTLMPQRLPEGALLEKKIPFHRVLKSPPFTHNSSDTWYDRTLVLPRSPYTIHQCLSSHLYTDGAWLLSWGGPSCVTGHHPVTQVFEELIRHTGPLLTYGSKEFLFCVNMQ